MPLPAKSSVLVTGGAGYVGSALIPKLLEAGHSVTVLDLYVYGGHVFGDFHGHENLREIKGDLRDLGVVEDAVNGADAVIHLACISNDPSFELDPNLGKSINFDAFRPLVRASKAAGVKRFVYASSSSVYGIKDEENVTEDLPLEPLTDYSKFKMLCEQVLAEEREDGFVTVTIRPSTVCGYAPRLRLDLTVNILTAHAFHNGAIKVFGGAQKRPNNPHRRHHRSVQFNVWAGTTLSSTARFLTPATKIIRSPIWPKPCAAPWPKTWATTSRS